MVVDLASPAVGDIAEDSCDTEVGCGLVTVVVGVVPPSVYMTEQSKNSRIDSN